MSVFDTLCTHLDGWQVGDNQWLDDNPHPTDCPFIHWWENNSQRYKDYMQKLKNRPKYFYFVTLTRNPKIEIADWLLSAEKVLRSERVKEIALLSMEHADTNVHIHAKVGSNNTLDRTCFKTYCNSHILDISKKPIKKDNGIERYMSKENKVFYDLDEFLKNCKEILKI